VDADVGTRFAANGAGGPQVEEILNWQRDVMRVYRESVRGGKGGKILLDADFRVKKEIKGNWTLTDFPNVDQQSSVRKKTREGKRRGHMHPNG